MKREFLAHECVLFRHIRLALNVAVEIEINERVELRFKRCHIVPQLPEPSSRSVLLVMLKALNSFEHIIRPRFGKRHFLKPFLHLESERFFLEIPLRTCAELFRAPIVPIPLAELAGRPLRGNHAAALAATKKSGERKIMRLSRMSGLRSLDKFFLHGFKQCRRKNWRKASGKILVAMLGKAEIRAIRQYSFHGSFAKWRSDLRRHAVERQKLRHRNERVAALRVLLERADDNLGLHRVRLDVARTRVVDVAEGRFGQPLATAQFLAHTALHVLLQVVAVIL